MEETVKLLEAGKILGYEKEIPEVISTGSSHVFLFRKNDIALKLYRRDNEHWNKYFSDMSEGEARKSFINLDYGANHFYSPDIYLGLKQANIRDGQIELSEPMEGDELIIEMKIVDDSSFLMNLLAGEQKVTSDIYYSIGNQVAEITSSNDNHKETDKNYYEISKERIVDLMAWAKNLSSFPEDFISDLENYVEKFVDLSRGKFEKLGNDDFVNVIDCHSANAVYTKGRVSFVDVLLPKEIWRTSRINENFFRIGADIAVLRGMEAYGSYLSGFMDVTPFDNSTEEFDLIYCAALMLCAQTAYAKKDIKHKPIADKYYSFIVTKLSNQ